MMVLYYEFVILYEYFYESSIESQLTSKKLALNTSIVGIECKIFYLTFWY